MSTKEILYNLDILKQRLEVYKEKLQEAINSGNKKEIEMWEDNIERLKNEIFGLEYELNGD